MVSELRSHVSGARRCDVTDAGAVAEAVGKAVQKFGRVDCAFVNAGVQGAFASTELYPLQDFQQTLNVNVVGSFITLQVSLLPARRHRAG
jgi:NAD(P)-dependent dehydrogenase (short-subunit alcohol dehydrogenase family)